MNYDIVIVAHEKDFNNIKYIVEYAEKNLDFDEVHLILSEREEYDESILGNKTSRPIYKHKESDVLKIDKSKIKYRPNWIYQMLLKMLQNVSKNDNYLIIEADCLILKKLNFFEDGKKVFYFTRDQYNHPYFRFNQKLLGIGREYSYSFISEFMMYDKNVVNHLVKSTGSNTIDEFLEKFLDCICIDEGNDAYPADYELYGNFYYKFYRFNFIPKTLNWGWTARGADKQNPNYTDSEIEELIKTNIDKDTISFHTWI